MNPIITIDGPSGVGKGSTSQNLADYLGWPLLDSGAIYRTFAVFFQQECSQGFSGLAEDLVANFPIHFKASKIYLSEQDVSALIRTEEVAKMASELASDEAVRARLLQKQRDFATSQGLIADGRDMGTVVFPEASLKIFLTASAQERAHRRVKQLTEQNQPADLAHILQLIEARDESDRNRAASPLKPASDAVTIDNSHLTINEVVSEILALAKQRQLV